MANASGVGDYRHECESSSLRKAKKQKIPKRGPGVAELEKILREQEEKNGHIEKGNGNGNGNGGICSSSVPVSGVHGHGNGSSWFGCGNVGANGRSKGVYIGRSGVFLPEQTLLPISWGSAPSETTWKHEEAPKMATGFSFPVLVSNGSAPPPMLQKNRLPMMMSTKRPRPSFPVENWQLVAPTPMPFQPIRPQVSRLDPLSSSSNNGVFNFGISRDQIPLPTSPSELNMKTCVSDHWNPSGNSSRPATTQNSPPDLSKFNNQLQFPFHENTERSLLQNSSSSSESEVSGYSKGFFSFLLQPEELQRGTTSAGDMRCLKTEKCCTEKTGDFIDLNLKL
ncbi:hypothetical protein V6N13_015530 [Hibiscus sabdariffa]|uniref:Uncharacterized protein n=1 Tax=Hibiscus sabdariffa TaxID=183260 RepID=A0ABR2CVX5_9ROSI